MEGLLYVPSAGAVLQVGELVPDLLQHSRAHGVQVLGVQVYGRLELCALLAVEEPRYNGLALVQVGLMGDPEPQVLGLVPEPADHNLGHIGEELRGVLFPEPL